jgi:type VI secretion system protein ImpA
LSSSLAGELGGRETLSAKPARWLQLTKGNANCRKFLISCGLISFRVFSPCRACDTIDLSQRHVSKPERPSPRELSFHFKHLARTMSSFEDETRQVDAWLLPLSNSEAPCGPDLEYDNEFLALTQAAAGKPESQFGAAEPPEWRKVLALAGALLDRSRDLRIAILWLRASLHLSGYGMLPVGLKLLNGLIETHWEHLHPLPDPDDGDPYGRVNALSLLRDPEIFLADLRETRLIQDRSIGELKLGDVLVAQGLSPARADETAVSKDQVARMLAAAVGKSPELRLQCQESATQARQLIALINDRLGDSVAPDLRPVYNQINAVAGLLPAADAAGQEAGAETDEPSGVGPEAGTSSRRGLAGAVTTRDEAMRAIDMVCEYLERSEPTNPAPLFLRRARQLIGYNFLQLLKELAPDALAGVAGMVGVDPEAVESPDKT